MWLLFVLGSCFVIVRALLRLLSVCFVFGVFVYNSRLLVLFFLLECSFELVDSSVLLVFPSLCVLCLRVFALVIVLVMRCLRLLFFVMYVFCCV